MSSLSMTRRRPLLLIASAFALGIALNQIFPNSQILLPLIVGVLILAALLLTFRRSEWVFAAFILVALLGMFRAPIGIPDYAKIEASLDQIESIQGVIVEFPVIEETRTRFVVRPDETTLKIQYTYLHRDQGPLEINYGDKVLISTKLEPPENFGDFDYRRYLHSKGIVATSMIWSPGQVRILDSEQGNPLLQTGYHFRNNIFDQIDVNLNEPASALLKSLIFGDRSELNEDVENAFRDSGVMHVLAVSGLHLGILVGLFFAVFRMFRFSHTAIYILLIPLVLIYLILVGFKLSLVRASLMLAFASLGWVIAERGWILRRWIDPIQGLALAALVILILTPSALFDVSFQLSFAATLGILLALDLGLPVITNFKKRFEYDFNERPRLANFASRFIHGALVFILISMAAQIAVTPVLGFQFDEIHLTSLLANIVVVPMATIAIWLSVAFLIATALYAPLASVLAHALEPVLNGLVATTQLFANLPGSTISIGRELQLIALALIPLIFSWELQSWLGWQLERLIPTASQAIDETAA